MSELRTYLGDAVYGDMNGKGDVILTVEDGGKAVQCIILDTHVLEALNKWVENVADKRAQRASEVLP